MAELYIKKMTEDVYLLDEDHAATGYLVIGSDKACVIDTMNGACNLYEEVRKLTDKPIVVVNTHGHPDHIFGNMYFDNALINPADLELAKFFSEEPEFIKILEEKNLKMPDFKPIFEGDTIDLGNRHLKVYELPGHTPGGIVLLLEEERILFTGDGINHHLWMQLDHSIPMSYFLISLDRIMFLEDKADKILHGHAHDFDDISLMRAVRDGAYEICNEITADDPDYQYFGGTVKQHPFKCKPDRVFQQPDHVICYDPAKQVPKRVSEMRLAWCGGDAKRDEGLKAPDTVEKHRNIMYGPICYWNLMDLYIPKDKSKNAGNGSKWPVIICIHGGGWFYGDKELYRFYCMHLAEFGFAVVNFNYRLAPENHFPSPIEDTAAVFNWVSENADKYNLDKNNIFMTGDSAGAQLVSQMACIVSNKEYASLFNINIPADLKFNAVSLACGIYSFPYMEEIDKISDNISDYLGDVSLLNDPRTKVLDHITSDYPPAFAFSSYCDFLYSACEPMSKLISSRGAESEFEIFGSPDRMDIGHVFHVNMKLEEGERANKAQIEFFKKHMI